MQDKLKSSSLSTLATPNTQKHFQYSHEWIYCTHDLNEYQICGMILKIGIYSAINQGLTDQNSIFACG